MKQRSRHTAAGGGTGRERAVPLTPGRKRTFYGIMLSTPLVLFVLLECLLRLFNYGPDLSLFTKEIVNGREYLTMNPDVQYRYFSRHQFSPTYAPFDFVSPKPAGTYRIFCLGGSTTVGYPYWYNGSFASFLSDRLRAIFPGKKIEILNIGMTATNSFTVNDMASDVLDFQPDLLIVYDGHNEFYGALGIASHESLGSVRWLTKLSLRLIHLRSFLLLRNWFIAAAGIFRHAPPDDPSRSLMEVLASGEHIKYGSRTYRNCLDMFKGNLDDLRALADEHRLPVIVASQVSNLRDQPPFVSIDDEDVREDARRSFHQEYERGMSEWREGKVASAAEDFRRAIASDSLHADAHYALARCLDSLGLKAAAREEYVKSRDDDQLRFRASSDFNKAIRSIADDRYVFFADMEKAFQVESPDSLVGRSLMLEHLHPDSRGAFIVARTYAHLMREHGLLATRGEWAAADTVPEETLWAERSVTALDEAIAQRRTEVLTSGWPFKTGTPIVEAIPATDTLKTIAEQVTRRKWSWRQGHEAAADFYLSRNDREDATREYRTIIDQLPFAGVQYYLRLAELLLEQKRIGEFAGVLRSSLEVKPTISAYRALGDVALNDGRAAEAVDYYEKMSSFPQSRREQADNQCALALAYHRAGRDREAGLLVGKILELTPGYPPAMKLLKDLEGNPVEKIPPGKTSGR